MPSARAFLLPCLLLPLGAWYATAGLQVVAQPTHDSAPMEVTTDTPEYCLYLQDRVHSQVHLASTPPPREVTDLSSEGQRMCEHGQTRGGIMRLRRALLLILREGGTVQR
jgi:hypothetical protein